MGFDVRSIFIFTLKYHTFRFSRGSVQTILPLNQRTRTGRLCSSYENQIKDLEKESLYMKEQFQKGHQMKRVAEVEVQDLQQKFQDAKVIFFIQSSLLSSCICMEVSGC